MKANPKIFKAYDIRGIWNKDWDEESVYDIGKGIAEVFNPKIVAIGYDMRFSSEAIFAELSKSLAEEGVTVKNLGLSSTELSYFAVNFVEEIDLAIIITASHNPGEYNGMKITLKEGSIGLNTGLDKIRDVALAHTKLEKEVTGKIVDLNLWQEYSSHVKKLAGIDFSEFKGMKIVVDPGNGVGGYMFDKVLSDLPVEVVKLNWKPDGGFPNHPPDPFIEENVEDVKVKVKEVGADLGISLDGDSDRAFFVDETGRYVPGYYAAAVLTEFMLQEKPGESIAHDPRYYKATVDVIKKYNGTPVKAKVGHTLIKRTMKEHNSYFSAECSGHIFFRENKFAESTMLATLLALKMALKKKFSTYISPLFNTYPISGEINFVVDDTQAVLSKIEENYKEGTIDTLDGVSFDFSEWRFNVRTSNTQPLLRLNVEATSISVVEEKVEELKGLIGGRIYTNH